MHALGNQFLNKIDSIDAQLPGPGLRQSTKRKRGQQNEQVLKKALASAVEMARSADASAPNAYQQAIDDLAASILETTQLAQKARQLLARMETKQKQRKIIENTRQVLSQAISTAERTRESGPLTDCLDKLINNDLLRDPCADLIKRAETLLEGIIREDREKVRLARAHACTYTTVPDIQP